MLEKKKHSLSYFQHMYTPNVLLLLVLYCITHQMKYSLQSNCVGLVYIPRTRSKAENSQSKVVLIV